MRTSEWVVIGYLACLALAAAAHHDLAARRRRRVTVASVLVSACVLLVAALPDAAWREAARDWLPGAYTLAGYWISGLFARVPHLGAERWLAAADRRVFAALRLEALSGGAPRVLLEYIELAYLLCYPLVPAGVGALYLGGHREQVDFYWTVVLVAAFLSYGALTLVVTRPPRALEAPGAIDRRPVTFRHVNWRVLASGSIQVNTIPSGHAATTGAAALVLIATMPAAGVAYVVAAVSIGAGAVLGRYHYAVDIALGWLVAALAFLWAAGSG